MSEENSKIKYINSQEAGSIKQQIESNKSVWLAEIDGKAIQSWKAYVSEIERVLKFPSSCLDSMDRYLDWIRDLEWIKQKEIIIFIKNFNDFCKSDFLLRDEIISDLNEIVLPYWEDTCNEIVGGTSKSFNVFILKD